MTNLEILKNDWYVRISLDKLKNYEICTIVKEIAEENYHWENFCAGDDIWFDGDANLTCTFKDTEKRVIEFKHLTALEKFCVALENGMEFDFFARRGNLFATHEGGYAVNYRKSADRYRNEGSA